jgi:hypothetical protein
MGEGRGGPRRLGPPYELGPSYDFRNRRRAVTKRRAKGIAVIDGPLSDSNERTSRTWIQAKSAQPMIIAQWKSAL